MVKEIAREQEGGPGLRAGDRAIAIPQYCRAHLVHQQPGEQRARQQDGEKVHQADDEFLGAEVHFAAALWLRC